VLLLGCVFSAAAFDGLAMLTLEAPAGVKWCVLQASAGPSLAAVYGGLAPLTVTSSKCGALRAAALTELPNAAQRCGVGKLA